MASHNVIKKNISKFRQTAVKTSSASRRFPAEDFEEARELREAGATIGREDLDKVINRLQQEYGEQFSEDEIHRYIMLMKDIPASLHREAIRLDRLERREEILKRREREAKNVRDVRSGRPVATPGEPGTLTQETPYVAEDEAAKHVRSELSRLPNWQAQAQELIGGRTRPGVTEQTLEESELGMLEQQMIEAGGEARTIGEIREPGELTQEEYEETFRPEDVITRPEDRPRVNELFKRRNQLLGLESRMRERLQKLGGTAEGKPEGVAKRKPVSGTQMRLPGVPEVKRDPRDKSLSWTRPPRATGVQGALDEVRNERARVERQLREFHPEAVISGQRQTREQTQAFTRRKLSETFGAITDPLAPEPRRRDVVRKPLDIIDATAAQLEAQARTTLPLGEQDPDKIRQEARRLARRQINDFITHTVNSYHAPTHGERLQAKQAADSILNRIAHQTQAEVDKRTEEARRTRIIQRLLPDEAYTAEGYARRSVDPSGARTLQDLRQQREKGEARMHPPTPTAPRAYTSAFEYALAQERGSAPPPPTHMPPTGFAEPPQDPNLLGGPRGAHKDPRFNELTVEDVYQAYGHEEPVKRLNWEKERLQAKFEKRETLSPEQVQELRKKLQDKDIPLAEKDLIQYRLDQAFTRPAPSSIRSIKQQAKFLRSRTAARTKGFVEGTEVIGVDNHGNPVALTGRTSRTDLYTNPNARAGVSPNIVYDYQLRNPEAGSQEAIQRQNSLESLLERRADIQKKLEATRVQGPLDQAFSRTREHQKELIKINQTIERQRKRIAEKTQPIEKKVLPTDLKTRFHEGRRGRMGNLLEEEYDQIVAPVTTSLQQSETVRAHLGERIPNTGRERTPENIDEIRYVPSPGATGQTQTVDDPEGSTKTLYEIRDRSGRWRQVDKEEHDAARTQRDIWDELPQGQRRGASPPAVQSTPIPRKIQYKYLDPKELELNTNARDIVTVRVPKMGRFGERLAYLQFGEDPGSRLDQYPGRAVKSYAQAQRLDAAQAITEGNLEPSKENLEKHGIRDKSEAKQLAEAALAAGFYTQRKHFMQGHAPSMATRAVKKVAGDKYNVGWAVNEAYVNPALEQIANLKFGIQHPLTSPTTGASGLGTSSLKYRQNWIDRNVMTRRTLERQLLQAERVGRTAAFVRQHRYERGPVGAFTRWRLGALERSPNYQFGNQSGIIPQAIKTAQDIQDEGTYEYTSGLTGRKDWVKDLPPDIRGQATENLRRYAEIRNQMKPSFDVSHIPSRGPGFFSRAIEHSGTERNILYGAAAVGAVAGAAYLYHRHQENKKPPEDKVALYNKVLPPAFETPKVFPHLHPTAVYKFGNTGLSKELGFANKEIPTQVGLDFKSKRVALRPMDRPAIHGSTYDPNLPIIGRPSFRGTKGGSYRQSFIYHTPNVRRKPGTNQITRLEGDQGRRTNIRRATHEVRILGHKVPGNFNIGRSQQIELSRTNPNRMTATERENIIWAAQALGPEHEEHVKAFYRGAGGVGAQRLLETWETPEEKQRIIRQKGRSTPQARAHQRRAEHWYSRATPAGRG